MSLRLDRAFLRVSGPDAIAFLDNLLTQDVTKLDTASVLYAALLTPQGKVVADMFLWARKTAPEPTVLIECHPSRAGELLRRFNLYKLRAKVSIEDITASMSAFYSSEPLVADTDDPRLPDSALGFREIGTIDLPLTGEGDAIIEHNSITLGIPAKELKARLAKWKQPKPNYTRGVLAKYAALVSSASEGAVTDKDLML